VSVFPEVLRRLRRHRDLTQKEAAKALNISASAWGMYESGKREPDIQTLHTLADFFGVTMDHLTGKRMCEPPVNAAKSGAADRLAFLEDQLRTARLEERDMKRLLKILTDRLLDSDK
jgi:transcriptional regulator with XRE-family HTH domain